MGHQRPGKTIFNLPNPQAWSHPYWLGSQGRKLSIGELARIQGFPIHDFCWPELDSVVRRLIGNSMAMPAIQHGAIAMIRAQQHPAAVPTSKTPDLALLPVHGELVEV